MLAIIGGTGLYELPGLEIAQRLSTDTPFGAPSGDILRGRLHDHDVLFLARHGAGHRLLPHEVNYRANVVRAQARRRQDAAGILGRRQSGAGSCPGHLGHAGTGLIRAGRARLSAAIQPETGVLVSYFPSLPADAGVRHILGLNPQAGRALIEFHTAVLRVDTALTAAHKELIAAYVSGLNACTYCHGVHRQTALAFGIEEDLIERLIDTAPVEPRLVPLLAYARKLTQEPAKMVASDAHAVFDAGWSERDLHDAVLTVGLFNLMNRLLEGHGVKGQEALYRDRGTALARDGYAPLLAWLPER